MPGAKRRCLSYNVPCLFWSKKTACKQQSYPAKPQSCCPLRRVFCPSSVLSSSPEYSRQRNTPHSLAGQRSRSRTNPAHGPIVRCRRKRNHTTTSLSSLKGPGREWFEQGMLGCIPRLPLQRRSHLSHLSSSPSRVLRLSRRGNRPRFKRSNYDFCWAFLIQEV